MPGRTPEQMDLDDLRAAHRRQAYIRQVGIDEGNEQRQADAEYRLADLEAEFARRGESPPTYRQ